ncbi:carnitine transporter [Ascosphaera atra]|nr:carnitine transporter [Ascosphaera atra]
MSTAIFFAPGTVLFAFANFTQRKVSHSAHISMASNNAPEAEPIASIEKKDNAAVAQLKSFVAGGVGGVFAVVVGHPFDLVKVRMQTAERGVYSGAMDVVRKTVAREGLARVTT